MGLLIALILLAIAIHLFVKTIIGDEISFEIGNKKRKFPNFFMQKLYPIANRIAPSVEKWKIDKQKQKIALKLKNAGLTDVLTPTEFYSFKVALAFTLPVIVYLYNYMVSLGLDITYVPVFAIFGWFYYDLWIGDTIKKRKEQIRKDMPFTVDLLTLSVEAGLDFGGAMQKVVEKGTDGPLRSEFELVMKEINIGSSRADALRNMSARIGIKEIKSFVSIIITAEKMGSPIGGVLRAQSNLLRHERFMKAEELGGKAATKVLIPMALFILPAVFITIFGPIILQKIYGGGVQ